MSELKSNIKAACLDLQGKLSLLDEMSSEEQAFINVQIPIGTILEYISALEMHPGIVHSHMKIFRGYKRSFQKAANIFKHPPLKKLLGEVADGLNNLLSLLSKIPTIGKEETL